MRGSRSAEEFYIISGIINANGQRAVELNIAIKIDRAAYRQRVRGHRAVKKCVFKFCAARAKVDVVVRGWLYGSICKLHLICATGRHDDDVVCACGNR